MDVLDSLSRLMPAVTTREHREKAALARRLLAAYAKSEDLVRIGAYRPGADEELDRAVGAVVPLRRFMAQMKEESYLMEESVAQLRQMAI